MPPPNAPHANEVEMPPKKSPMGPLVSIIIIIFLLFVGAFYLWGEKLNQQNTNTIPYIPGDTNPTTTTN